ncbi:MAG: hypothetical protein AB7I57_22885 [Pirellulales bacterium]
MAERINYSQWTVGKAVIRAQAARPVVTIEGVPDSLKPDEVLELAAALIEAAHLANGLSPLAASQNNVSGANVADLARLVRDRPSNVDAGTAQATPEQQAAVANLGGAIAANVAAAEAEAAAAAKAQQMITQVVAQNETQAAAQ